MKCNVLSNLFSDNNVVDLEALKVLSQENQLYAIFMTARSGSTWLMDLIQNAGGLGTPHEWFNYEYMNSNPEALDEDFQTRDINKYISSIIERTRGESGIAGVEFSYFQVKYLIEMMPKLSRMDYFKANFYLRRRDIVAQAISLYRSNASGLFHSTEVDAGLRRRYNDIEYNRIEISRWVEHILECERGFEAIFSGCEVRPISLFYEDLVLSPSETLRTITAALGCPTLAQIPRSKVQKLSDSRNLAWAERFYQERGAYMARVERQRPAVDA